MLFENTLFSFEVEKKLSNWALIFSKQRYILIVGLLLNFRRVIGNLCAISSKGKKRGNGILFTMPSVVAWKMELQRPVFPSRTVFHLSKWIWGIDAFLIFTNILPGQQSTTDISIVQHTNKSRDAGNILALSDDSLWPWRMLGRALLNYPKSY